MAPVIWILLNFATGSLFARVRQVWRLPRVGPPTNLVTLMRALITVCGVVLAMLSYRAFRKEIMGTRDARPSFWGNLVVMAIYYGVLIFCFARSVGS